jgi:membrane-associated phospholipid phosphatase
MRSSEWVALVYFAALAMLAWIRPLPASRRIQVAIAGVLSAAAIVFIARNGPLVVRDWTPALWVLVGYYVSGRFFVRPSEAMERWLQDWDRRILGDPTTRFAAWPPFLLAYLEVVYVGCFLLVPAGFAVLVATGRAALADRYWTMVVAAELGSFAPLSIFQTRPPWLLERPPTLPHVDVHRFAARMVELFTIRANTFPSGHVAGSLAVGLALVGVVPAAAAVFLILAASIALACVVGRYHYVVDLIAGAALALLIWAVVGLSR